MTFHRCPFCTMPFTHVGKLDRCFVCKAALPKEVA